MNITIYIEPNSISPSIICRGTYNDKPAYYKISLINKDITKSLEQGLSYEGDIYKKINNYKNNEHVKNINAFFLNYLDYKKIYKSDLDDSVKGTIQNYKEFIDRLNSLAPGAYDLLRIVITEDNDSVTLDDMIKTLNDSHEIGCIKIILADLLYPVLLGINVLYDFLNINHNDMHFKNILCCKKEQLTAYHIGSNEFYVSKYKINIFDFDLSYQSNHNNNRLSSDYCKISGSCNNKSLKDYYLFIQSILFCWNKYRVNTTYTKLTKCLEEIFVKLVPEVYHESFVKNIIDITSRKKDLFWSAYCAKLDYNNKLTMSLPCNNTNVSDIYVYWLKDIVEKFRKEIIEKQIPIEVNIEGDNRFILVNRKIREQCVESVAKNKYLKYKNKYIKIKAKLNL
jgi:hypothetical protein